jgi:hypothetical protein
MLLDDVPAIRAHGPLGVRTETESAPQHSCDEADGTHTHQDDPYGDQVDLVNEDIDPESQYGTDRDEQESQYGQHSPPSRR